MPRYFFHVRDGQEYLDADGSELEDLAAARRHSVQIAAQLLGQPGSEFWEGQDWQLHVEDDAGTELFRLHFQAVVNSSTAT